jgi:hypothetical protein
LSKVSRQGRTRKTLGYVDRDSTQICFCIDRLWVCVSKVLVDHGSATYGGCGVRFSDAEKNPFYELVNLDEDQQGDLAFLVNADRPLKDIMTEDPDEARHKVLDLTSNIGNPLVVIRRIIVACLHHAGADGDTWSNIATECSPKPDPATISRYILNIPYEYDSETQLICEL